LFKKVYLDNAATSWPKPKCVVEAMSNFLIRQGCNPGRAGYDCSIEAGRQILKTREKITKFFGGISPENVVFTQNITYALNFAFYGLIKKGDHIITSDLEHNAVWRPLKTMEKKGLISISVFPFSQKEFSPEEFSRLLKPETRFVVINHASNISGQVLPVKEIGAAIKDREIFFVVDTAQTAGSLSIDATEIGIDVMGFTGHKGLFGPPGVGGMVLSERVAEIIKPVFQGGTGSVSDSEFQPGFLPDKMESGTPNTPGIIGLREGIEFIEEEGLVSINKKTEKLKDLLQKGLEEIPGVKIVSGPGEDFVSTFSITMEGQDPGFLAYYLGEKGIMVRSGLHCCPAGHRALKTFPEGTLRFSPGYFNSQEEIQFTINTFEKIVTGK